MSQLKRKLPHWELSGSTYFVTFRVRRCLGKVFEASGQAGKPVLHQAVLHQSFLLAGIVQDALMFFDGERYVLDAYVIMPDHVHLLIRPLSDWTLSGILQGLKGFTARKINMALGRHGRFWQRENFDHLIRDEDDWLDKLYYIHGNPLTAGLVGRPEDYPFSSLGTIYGAGCSG